VFERQRETEIEREGKKENEREGEPIDDVDLMSVFERERARE